MVALLWSTLGVITIIVSIHHIVYGFTYNETFEFNTATLALADHVCSGTEVVESTIATSDLQCTFLCVQEATCEGSFYQDEDKICVLCTKYYTDTTFLTSYTGMKYYRITAPEIWNGWGSWSTCSHTCGGGTRRRSRTCHQASPVSCTGASSETVVCNTYNCTPTAKTCAEWASLGLNQSSAVEIDPLQSGSVYVFCDFDLSPGKAYTVMGHNYEARTHINGPETCYAYSIDLTYDIGLAAATEVVDLSSECQQWLKFECKRISFRSCVAWVNRTGSVSEYFTGSPTGKYCACGETNSCDAGASHCNCDNDDIWRKDEGYVTSKSDLPITGFRAGDTGHSTEEGYHTIGELMCA